MQSQTRSAHQVRVALDGKDAAAELPELVGWLRRRRDIGRHTVVQLVAADSPATAPGAVVPMGDVAVIQLLVDTTFQTANLVLALLAWRRACHPTSTVTIHRGGADPMLLPDDGTERPDADPNAEPGGGAD